VAIIASRPIGKARCSHLPSVLPGAFAITSSRAVNDVCSLTVLGDLARLGALHQASQALGPLCRAHREIAGLFEEREGSRACRSARGSHRAPQARGSHRGAREATRPLRGERSDARWLWLASRPRGRRGGRRVCARSRGRPLRRGRSGGPGARTSPRSCREHSRSHRREQRARCARRPCSAASRDRVQCIGRRRLSGQSSACRSDRGSHHAPRDRGSHRGAREATRPLRGEKLDARWQRLAPQRCRRRGASRVCTRTRGRPRAERRGDCCVGGDREVQVLAPPLGPAGSIRDHVVASRERRVLADRARRPRATACIASGVAGSRASASRTPRDRGPLRGARRLSGMSFSSRFTSCAASSRVSSRSTRCNTPASRGEARRAMAVARVATVQTPWRSSRLQVFEPVAPHFARSRVSSRSTRRNTPASRGETRRAMAVARAATVQTPWRVSRLRSNTRSASSRAPWRLLRRGRPRGPGVRTSPRSCREHSRSRRREP
jgi:hypothetical protein